MILGFWISVGVVVMVTNLCALLICLMRKYSFCGGVGKTSGGMIYSNNTNGSVGAPATNYGPQPVNPGYYNQTNDKNYTTYIEVI